MKKFLFVFSIICLGAPVVANDPPTHASPHRIDFQTAPLPSARQIVFQTRHGMTCGQVGVEDLFELYPESARVHPDGAHNPNDPNCDEPGWFGRQVTSIGNTLSLMSINPSAEIEARAMEEAAQLQVARDRCMVATLERVQESENVRNDWNAFITFSWIRLQKIRLMRDRCRRNFWYEDAANVERLGLRDEWERRWESPPPEGQDPAWRVLFESKEERDSWKELCLDEERQEAMMMAEAFTLNTVPYLNSPQIYEGISGSRNLILNRKTGQPLSDEDILNMDLRNRNAVLDLVDMTGMYGNNNAAMGAVIQQRQDQIRGFEDSLSREGYPPGGGERDSFAMMDEAQRQYLYHNGAYKEVMVSRGMLSESPLTGELSDLTPAAVCTMSDYETSFASSALSGVSWGLMGGGLGWAYRLVNAGRRLTRAERIFASPIGSGLEGGFTSFTRDDIYNSTCVKRNTDFTRGSTAPTSGEMGRIGGLLPNETDPEPFSRDNLLDESYVGPSSAEQRQVLGAPECREQHGTIHNHMAQMACWEALLGGVLGLKSGIAFEVYRANN